MAPVHYTDFSEKTFERALEGLGEGVPPELLAVLGELLTQGQIHDVARIVAAVRKQVAQGSCSAS